MENLGVSSSESLFLGLASLGEGGQGISSISLSLAIIDLKVVPREFLGSPDLLAIGIHESTKVVVVGEDEDQSLLVGFSIAMSYYGDEEWSDSNGQSEAGTQATSMTRPEPRARIRTRREEPSSGNIVSSTESAIDNHGKYRMGAATYIGQNN